MTKKKKKLIAEHIDKVLAGLFNKVTYFDQEVASFRHCCDYTDLGRYIIELIELNDNKSDEIIEPNLWFKLTMEKSDVNAKPKV